jgi:cytochrome P450
MGIGEPRLSSTMPPPAGHSADGSSDLLADMSTFVKSSLVFTDPPDHTRLRRLVLAAFVPSVINELAGPISMITNRMPDEHADSLDLAAHLAEPMPIAVLGQLLGVSLLESEGAQLKQWCDDFLLPFGRDVNTLSSDELARVKAAAQGLHGFVDTVLSRPQPAAPTMSSAGCSPGSRRTGFLSRSYSPTSCCCSLRGTRTRRA